MYWKSTHFLEFGGMYLEPQPFIGFELALNVA